MASKSYTKVKKMQQRKTRYPKIFHGNPDIVFVCFIGTNDKSEHFRK